MRLIALLLLLITFNVHAKQPERYYQEKWCEGKGVTEYVLPDRTRVDCLTSEYAIEFDFAKKWAESIGQALYYGKATNRKPAIAIIVLDWEKDQRYLNRLYTAIRGLGIKVIIVSE